MMGMDGCFCRLGLLWRGMYHNGDRWLSTNQGSFKGVCTIMGIDGCFCKLELHQRGICHSRDRWLSL